MKLPAILSQRVKNRSSQRDIHAFLSELHASAPDAIVAGRNVLAGYLRAEGILRGDFIPFLKADPAYQEASLLACNATSLCEMALANLFFILKYGLPDLSGDIIQCGSDRGGTALFIAHSVRCLGLSTKVYVFNTLHNAPQEKLHFNHLLNYKEKMQLDNLVLIKGIFEESLTMVLPELKNIVLAHIAFHSYPETKSALTAVQPYMKSAGGYLVVDHAAQSNSSIEVFHAVEEMVEEKQLHAEQASPHFVYRIPRISYGS